MTLGNEDTDPVNLCACSGWMPRRLWTARASTTLRTWASLLTCWNDMLPHPIHTGSAPHTLRGTFILFCVVLMRLHWAAHIGDLSRTWPLLEARAGFVCAQRLAWALQCPPCSVAAATSFEKIVRKCNGTIALSVGTLALHAALVNRLSCQMACRCHENSWHGMGSARLHGAARSL